MPKSNQQYWAERLNEVAQNRFDITNEVMQKELKAMYDEVANKMQIQVEDLYYKMLEDELQRNEIWTYKRYRDLEKQINREMVSLGNKEVKLLNSNLELALQEIYKETGIIPNANMFALLSPQMVKSIVSRPWSAQHFTSTCWKNKEALAQQLRKGITECIITGKSKDKLVADVIQKMKVGFNNADRVVRTELMHTINQGQTQRYKDTGYTELIWNAAFDARTCGECEDYDGRVIPIDSPDIPPIHPRCRCTVYPVLDSLKEVENGNNSDNNSDNNSMIAVSALFVNKNDLLFKNAEQIDPLDGYEDIVCHANEKQFYLYSDEGSEYIMTPNEFADRIINSNNYNGGDIRLIACRSGADENGAAQMLADILKVDVIAPTETTWVNEEGEIFITDKQILAEMWYNKENVKQTGEWKTFKPNGKE